MTETKRLMDQPPRRSAFAEGVARLDAIAKPLGGTDELRSSVGRTSAVNPDEAWNRNFMSMGIGPDTLNPPSPPAARPVIAPQEELAPVRAVEPAAPNREFGKPSLKSGLIGAAIGKPQRRSFLSRLIRG
ncbi:MAG TPA: hypothetical protein VGG48_19680 [Rhizomicrobium sp.]|jgi:hypothetical protein